MVLPFLNIKKNVQTSLHLIILFCLIENAKKSDPSTRSFYQKPENRLVTFYINNGSGFFI